MRTIGLALLAIYLIYEWRAAGAPDESSSLGEDLIEGMPYDDE